MEENTTKQPGLFEKGGKFGFLHSTVDAFDTFLRVPATVTRTGAHVRDAIDLKRILILVVIAIVPAALFGMWNVGYQYSTRIGEDWTLIHNFWFGFLKVLPLYLVSYIVGLGIEFTFAQIRNEEVSEGYLVSGMLIPLIVPVDTPLWTLALAVAFAVVFGKEVFGGSGMNFLNPALLARAFLFFSYPSKMSGSEVWIAHRCGEDAITGATPLATGGLDGLTDAGYSFWNLFAGTVPGSVGETSVIAILIGAVILIWTGIASWKIILSTFIGGALLAYLLPYSGAENFEWWEQLTVGGFAFGAVFMATDPVTSPRTEGGKWIFGFLIGAMAIIIRVLNPGYPEGMMLAILLMNVFAPLFDYFFVQSNINKRAKRAIKK